MANKLIPASLRLGRILDVGCGTFPLTLSRTSFREKFGVDRVLTEEQVNHFAELGVSLTSHDLSTSEPLPFADDFFDVITMLAVAEHLDRPVLAAICAEAARVLKPGGLLIATTPASWTAPILTLLARLGLVSSEEIEEHRDLLSRQELIAMLRTAGFSRVDSGHFELYLNTWFRAQV